MSFKKITDPKKRDFIVNEYLKTRQNIHKNLLSERVGDLSTQYELSELFNPVTDMHKYLKDGLVIELKLFREGMNNLQKTIRFPQFPSTAAYDDDGEKDVDVFIGDIGERYLRKLLPCLVLIRHLDCGIRMVNFTLGTESKNKKTI